MRVMCLEADWSGGGMIMYNRDNLNRARGNAIKEEKWSEEGGGSGMERALL